MFYKDIYIVMEFESGLLGIISQPELWKKTSQSPIIGGLLSGYSHVYIINNVNGYS